MLLIPVIDLMQGQVVRAVRGDRQSYRPIVSRLCAGSDPVEVAQALCRHSASNRLYVADLDALTGGAAQADALRSLLQALPGLELWLDAGFADAAAAAALRGRFGAAARRVVPVFASESLRSLGALQEAFAPPARGVLSLDRRGGQRLDAAGCWDHPELWPARVIVMTLERVGADAGPDLDTLRAVRARAPQAEMVGAGGIRHAEDLRRAREAGAYAWLVASALHDGKLPPAGDARA
ncbi:MAG: nickel transporter [Burkholderiaceae bacterium]|nr:nickel transporter [Burkholderiaceae bacterium]